MRLILAATLLGIAVASRAETSKFAFETTLLTAEDIGTFSDIGPATNATQRKPRAECRAFPGSSDWPDEADWKRLNASLGGALLKPVPAAAVCYPGRFQDVAKCTALVNDQTITKAHFDDPLGLSTAWPAGNPCPAVLNATGSCEQGGLPVYVVNATSVKQIQIAVNFARNRNLRLVVKNTGHDFVGRSTGAGALSIWTHYLKGFTPLANYTAGAFRGDAAHVGVSLEAWEAHQAMATHNVTIVAPSFSTVGAFAGYMSGGGHSSLVSYHGLASDQVLSLNVVTASGSFVTASPGTNPDLFFALRGGGGGTYGIITSVVVKTFAPVNITSTAKITISSLETGLDAFWQAMRVYHSFGGAIADAGGIDRTYIYPLDNATVFNFTTQVEFPSRSVSEVSALLSRITSAFASLNVTAPFPVPTVRPWSAVVLGEGSPIRNERFASRLMPRSVWDSPTGFSQAMSAMRKVCEGGYQVHGTHMGPSLAVAGYPGNTSSVNPAFRKAVMHLVVYDSAHTEGVTAAQDKANRTRLHRYTDYLREATKQSGSYINEAAVDEPAWQASFFGKGNYERLLEVKRRWDPEGVFWGPATVGSEGWKVAGEWGDSTQDGRLCRV